MKYLFQNPETHARLSQWSGNKNLFVSAAFNLQSWRGHNVAGIVRSLLRGILSECQRLIQRYSYRSALPLLWPGKDAKPIISDDEARIILERLIASKSTVNHSRFCFFIDALDEFGDASQSLDDLIKMLKQWVEMSEGAVKLCISSRDIPLQSLSNQCFSLEEANSTDIELYTRTFIARELEPFLVEEERGILERQIVKRAAGAFIWAHLALTEFAAKARAGQLPLQQTLLLDEVPKTLSALYDDIWESVSPHDNAAAAAVMICLGAINLTSIPAFILWAIWKFPESFRRIIQTTDQDLLSLAPELKRYFHVPNDDKWLEGFTCRRLLHFQGNKKWDRTAFLVHQSVLDWIRLPKTLSQLRKSSVFLSDESHLEALCYGYLLLIQADNSIATEDPPDDDERTGSNLHAHCLRIVLLFSTFFDLVTRLVGRVSLVDRVAAVRRLATLNLLGTGSWTGEILLGNTRFNEHSEMIQDIMADISALRDQISGGEVLALPEHDTDTSSSARPLFPEEAKVAPDESAYGSRDGLHDTNDSDLASEASFALSMFSNPSLASTASSVLQGADLSEQFVFILFRDDDTKALYEEVIEKLGLRLFSRTHAKILRTYFRDLKARLDNELQRRAVRALAHPMQRREITELIARFAKSNDYRDLEKLVADNEQRKMRLNRLLERASARPGPVVVESREVVNDVEPTDDQSEESDAEKVEEDDGTEAPPPLEEITKFLLNGPPFQTFKCRLRFLARPPHGIPSALSQGQDILRMYLESQFEEAAVGEYEWIRALEEVGYTYEEIADLLFEEHHDSPWIYFDPNTSLENSLVDMEKTPTSRLNDVFRSGAILPDLELSACGISVIRRLVEELCGLGGVAPASRNLGDWNGTVNFTDDKSRAIVSHLSTVSSLNSTKTVISRLLRVAERLHLAALILHDSKYCSGSFTILAVPAEQANESREVWLRHVDIQLIVRFVGIYRDLLQLDETAVEASAELGQLQFMSESTVLPTIAKGKIDQRRLPVEEKIWTALNISSLAIQLLSVGLLSFAQAHIGSLRPFFLDSTLKIILLHGLHDIDYPSASNMCIEVGMAELTCLSAMTGGPVIVFRTPTNPDSTEQQTRFDVRATPNDILNTWGPGGLIHPKSSDAKSAVAIAVGGGYIIPPNAEDENTKYHWGRGLSLSSTAPALDKTAEIVIGATISVNDHCSSDEDICWRRSLSNTAELGTYQSYYETTEYQLGAQAGCDYATAVFQNVKTKMPGATLKDEILKSLIDFPTTVFDYYCGVRISYCTGVAQRVPMTQLLGDMLPVFATTLTGAAERRPWKELESRYDVTEIFRGTESAWADPQSIRNWLGTLRADRYNCILRLIRLIVKTLAATGLSPCGNFFAVAWPRGHLVKNCLRVRFDDDDAKWIPMLADAEDCATFAYITNACLPVEGVVDCRGPNPMWASKVHLLETAVSFPTTQSVGSLCHGETYFFLKDGDEPAWFRAIMGEGISHASLVKVGTLWSISWGVKRRLVLLEEKKRNERRIQEKRIFGHLAEEVRVHSRLR